MSSTTTYTPTYVVAKRHGVAVTLNDTSYPEYQLPTGGFRCLANAVDVDALNAAVPGEAGIRANVVTRLARDAWSDLDVDPAVGSVGGFLILNAALCWALTERVG